MSGCPIMGTRDRLRDSWWAVPGLAGHFCAIEFDQLGEVHISLECPFHGCEVRSETVRGQLDSAG